MSNEKTADSMRSRRLSLLIAVVAALLALVFRWAYIEKTQVSQPVSAEARSEAADFYRCGRNLVDHGIFSRDRPAEARLSPDSFRDPGYAFLVAAFLRGTPDFSTSYVAILRTQAVLGAASILFLILAARHWLSPACLAIAGVLMAIWPHSVAMTSFLLPDTLATFLAAAALLGTGWGVSRRSMPAVILAGSLWGLAGLTDALFIPLAPILALALWKRNMFPLRLAACLAVAGLMLPVAWSLRSPSAPSTGSAFDRTWASLVKGSWPSFHDDYRWMSRGDIEAAVHMEVMGAEIQTGIQDLSKGIDALAARMSEQPLTYLRWYASKPWLTWSWDIGVGDGDIYVYPSSQSPYKPRGEWVLVEVICFVLNPVLAVLGLLGIALALARRNSDGALLAVGALAAMATLLFIPLHADPRNITPLRGVEILLATYTISSAAQAWRSRFPV